MKPLPIRWKFALWTAALVGVVVVTFAVATFLNLAAEQRDEMDLEIEAAGRHLASLPPERLAAQTPGELVQFEPWMNAAVFDAQGALLRRDPALPESIARAALLSAGVRSVGEIDGAGWRVKSFNNGAQIIVVAHSLEEVREIARHIATAFGLSLPVVLLLSAVGGWWVSGRTLAALRDFTAAAEGIRADQLHRRISAPAAQDEIRRLADVLNAMLARLEKSFEQSQRFAADASHELRTPLTIIGGEVGRLLRTPNLSPEAEELALSVQEEIGRLQRITEQMLLLARFDAGTAAIAHSDVNLSKVVALACEDAELLASAGAVEIASAIPPEVHVAGDEVHLRRLALNLLDNAIRYNEPKGRVSCTLTTDGNAIRLTVGNTGPEIPVEARANLFQRFFRSDAARTRGGHGLGLSLCREIAHAHGGEIALADSKEAGWTEFVVTLPASTQAKAA